ncbi:efflux RND transporter periplasmic adaptor subunit [Trinickia diaoshuihuensis]|uniref:efflux RND transporter periplasmic adaptor subunit n=1 Tax=Trinickia diaoshuihuensis TaxID=2292265 RepID=UPI000E21FC80|nr:efflux RND transporter periplasmic adaptor subunit [Trinickia diaoshuihuensis]
MKVHQRNASRAGKRLARAAVAAVVTGASAVAALAAPASSPGAIPPAAPKAALVLPVAAQPHAPAASSAASASDVRVQLVADTIATIGAPMPGRLTQFPLHDGDRFKQGQVLARFECGEKEAALAHARAVLESRKSVNESKQRLRALGTSSQVEYEVAAADEKQAAADVQAAQSLVSNCSVAAPFSGRVSAVYAHNYQYLQTGAPLLEVLSDKSLELEMIVPSMWLSWLKPGSALKVTIDETGKTYPATLDRLSGKVDPVSRSVKVYARIDNPSESLLPGMSGHAIFNPPAGIALTARQ